MNEYTKIQTMYKREMHTQQRNLIVGEWSTPELEYLQNNQWDFYEKIDGTNIRVLFYGENITFKGRTDRAVLPPPLLASLQQLITPEAMKSVFSREEEDYPAPVCMYGEGYGKTIQHGHRYLADSTSFILFDIKIGAWWLSKDHCELLAKELNIDMVPHILTGTLHDAIETVRHRFVSRIAEDETYIAEGLVGTPTVPMYTRTRQRIITKIKHRDFQ